jgi:hypothetical protein
MKHHFLTGVAVVAALALSAPVWAQTTNPSGGNAMGMPGPNPGGPGLTPYSSGPNPGGAALSGPRTAPSTTAPSAMPPSSMSDTSSAMPPKHRASRHASHGKMAGHHRGKGQMTSSASSTANQLNQEELQRLQAGNFSNPSAPPPPGAMPPGQPGGGRTSPRGTVQ